MSYITESKIIEKDTYFVLMEKTKLIGGSGELVIQGPKILVLLFCHALAFAQVCMVSLSHVSLVTSQEGGGNVVSSCPPKPGEELGQGDKVVPVTRRKSATRMLQQGR